MRVLLPFSLRVTVKAARCLLEMDKVPMSAMSHPIFCHSVRQASCTAQKYCVTLVRAVHARVVAAQLQGQTPNNSIE